MDHEMSVEMEQRHSSSGGPLRHSRAVHGSLGPFTQGPPRATTVFEKSPKDSISFIFPPFFHFIKVNLFPWQIV